MKLSPLSKLSRLSVALMLAAPLVAQASTPTAAQTEQINQIRKGTLIVKTASNASVSIQQKKHDFPFGSALSHYVFGNYSSLSAADKTTYLNTMKANFNQCVLENGHKWSSIEPSRDSLDVVDADAATNWCLNNGLSIRGHTMFWAVDEYVDQWVKDLNNTDLQVEMREHVSDLTSRYNNKVFEWDVNNELLHGNYYGNRLGNQINYDMFNWAKSDDSKLRLYLNDYNVGVSGNWQLLDYVQQVRDFQAANVPVGGIGIQGHHDTVTDSVAPDSMAMRTAFDTLAQFNLPIKITEYDFNTTDEVAKEKGLVEFYATAFAHPAVDGVLMWGFWQGQSWKNNTYLWRQDWSETPAAQSYRNLVYNLWWTNLSASADANGVSSNRVFYGEHQLSINGGAAQSISLNRKEGNKTIDLVSGIQVSMPSPRADSIFAAGDTITLDAAALDTNGSISKVEFYQNGNLLATSSVAPFSYNWSSVAAGNYNLTAKAYDNSGNITETPVTAVSVNSHPSASYAWAMDETSGTTVNATNGGINGVNVGADISSGKNGNALAFDGTNPDRVDFNSNFATNGALTVSAWVKPTIAPNGVGRVIAGTYDWDPDPSLWRGWSLGNDYGSTDKVEFSIIDSSGKVVTAKSDGFFAKYLNQWVHVAGVFKPGESVALYINGVLQYSQATDVSSIAFNTTNMRIGARADWYEQGQWAGSIDDVKLWHKALSAREITKEALGAVPPAAAFSVDKTSGLAPLTVQFSDSSSGNISSWAWDFNNDGVVDSTARNPSYSYSSAGSYSVSLKVTDVNGSSNTQTKAGYINVSAADTVPNAYDFTNASNAALNTLITSPAGAIAIQGMNAPTSISISAGNGQYKINSGSWTNSAGTVNPGDSVSLALMSSAAPSTTVSTTVNIGGVVDNYSVTTRTADTTPNAFSFPAVTGATQATFYTSAPITVSGVDAGVNIPLSTTTTNSACAVINNAATCVTTGTVKLGDTVQARVKTASKARTATSVTVTIGGVKGTYKVTTK